MHLFGLTAPLITTSDGKKMGKTASGAMWLNKYDYDSIVDYFIFIFIFIRIMYKFEISTVNFVWLG